MNFDWFRKQEDGLWLPDETNETWTNTNQYTSQTEPLSLEEMAKLVEDAKQPRLERIECGSAIYHVIRASFVPVDVDVSALLTGPELVLNLDLDANVAHLYDQYGDRMMSYILCDEGKKVLEMKPFTIEDLKYEFRRSLEAATPGPGVRRPVEADPADAAHHPNDADSARDQRLEPGRSGASDACQPGEDQAD